MSSINVQPVVPYQSINAGLSSTNKHILRTKQTEFISESQNSYTNAGNNLITFRINSPDSFVDFINSYIRFDLSCTLTNDGSTDDATKYLSEGGAHSLFRRVMVRLANGTILQDANRYNKRYAMLSNSTEEREHVESVGQCWGDSVGNGYSLDAAAAYSDANGGKFSVTSTIASATFTTGTKVLALVAGNALDELAVGDQITISFVDTADVGAFTSTVASITDEDNVVLAETPGVSLVAGEIKSIHAIRQAKQYQSMRSYAANNTTTLCFSPAVELLQLKEWMPLFLMRGGIEISLELERPEYVLASHKVFEGTGFSTAQFTISNPKYVVRTVQPDESLAKIYLDLYRGRGLYYNYMSYRHNLEVQSGGAAATFSRAIHAGARSVRHTLISIQDLRCETITSATAAKVASTYNTDSVALSVKANLQDYVVEIGSLRFPLDIPVVCTDQANSEALVQLDLSMNQYNAILYKHRFAPYQWQERDSTGGNTDSSRFYMAAKLDRDTSPLTGIDSSLQPLQLVLVFDGAYTVNSIAADRYVHVYSVFDSVMSLSASGTTVRS